MEGDAKVIASGGRGQYLYQEGWKPCAVDRVLKDGDTVTLGEARLTARHTPGHTRGCTTWLMQTTDGGRLLNVVIVGSPNVNPGYEIVTNRDYPEIADDYAKTFRLLESIPCDIFLRAHGSYYGLEAKYARLQKHPKSNRFVDPKGYQAYVEDRAQAFREAAQKQKPRSNRLVRRRLGPRGIDSLKTLHLLWSGHAAAGPHSLGNQLVAELGNSSGQHERVLASAVGRGQSLAACRKHPVRGNGLRPTGLFDHNSNLTFLPELAVERAQ